MARLLCIMLLMSLVPWVASAWLHAAPSARLSLAVFSTPRQPRRKLQKRRRRREKDQALLKPEENEFWATAESKPLVSSRMVELGEDYWIDEVDLQKEQEKEKRRPPEPGRISDEKLWGEVLSPYKQNWIGLASVLMLVLATIVTKFPELLQSPTIPIPDL